MAATNKTRHGSPQFCRASIRATHSSRLRRRRNFSANCISCEFGEERKFASFSPEFLVLTMSLAVRTHSPVMTICRPSRRGFSKQEAFAGANSAGIRDELQS